MLLGHLPKSMGDYCVCLYVPVTVSTDGAGNIYTKRGGGGGESSAGEQALVRDDGPGRV